MAKNVADLQGAIRNYLRTHTDLRATRGISIGGEDMRDETIATLSQVSVGRLVSRRPGSAIFAYYVDTNRQRNIWLPVQEKDKPLMNRRIMEIKGKERYEGWEAVREVIYAEGARPQSPKVVEELFRETSDLLIRIGVLSLSK